MQRHMVNLNLAGARNEAWVILAPEVLSLVPGMNMETEAQDDFYGPTNK